MCSNEHLPEFDEVAVFLVVDFDDTPRVCPTSDFSPIGRSNDSVRSDDSEGDLALSSCQRPMTRSRGRAHDDLVVLLDGLFVFILVLWRLENPNAMVVNISEDLPFCQLSGNEGCARGD